MHKFTTFAISIQTALLLLAPLLLRAQTPADEVDPLIGTSGGGGTFPGAVRPWGMVSVSPHTAYRNASAYWHPSRYLTGFGHIHVSGPGCADMGDIELMPTTGSVETRSWLYRDIIRTEFETARAGYYSALLERYNVRAEMTATIRCGISRYTFPAGRQSNVLLNVTEPIAPSTGGEVRVISNREVEGWNKGGDFCRATAGRKIYFVARLDQPADTVRTWSDSVLSSASHATGTDVGVAFSWREPDSARQIVVRVGISYVSIANARQNLDAEGMSGDFDSYHQSARDEWNRELGKVRIEGGTADKRKIFYTALYHSLIHPNVLNDVNGEYPTFRERKIKKAEGYTRYTMFGLWGTYRSLHSLLTLVWPEQQTDMMRSMVEQYRESGWLPLFELSGYETQAMVGDPAAAVLVDTWTKGLHGFDIDVAFEAMLKTALNESGDRPTRPDVEKYMRHGYVPMIDPKRFWFGAASATLEYAYADWHIARLAHLLGYKGDAKQFDARAKYYENIYDPVTGFFRPRNADGSWYEPYDPFAMSQDSTALYFKGGPGGPGYNEGNGWHHLFMVPHDIPGLARLMGGDHVLVQKLQLFFDLDQWIWNENDYGHPYIFTYFPGEEWRTVKAVRKLVRDFSTRPDGVPGNEDTGSLSSWYIFNALGFYPHCTGGGEYRVGTPFFRKIEIDLDRRYYPGELLTIEADNVNEANDMIYARTVEFNGKQLRRRAITHEELTRGGVLDFEMSSSREIVSSVPMSSGAVAAISDLQVELDDDATITFTLGGRGATTVSIYDMLGRRVATLADGDLPGGPQRFVWNPGSRGVYYCVVEFEGETMVEKMVW